MNFEIVPRWLFLCLLVVLCVSASGQKAEFFDNLTFDSTYSILGVARGYGKYPDSLERFWFLLTDPAAMQTLQKDWVFSKPARPTTFNQLSFDVYVIKDKRLAARTGLIYPFERMVTPGNGRWYAFDTSKLVALHSAHPVHYHTEQKYFQTYTQYAAYGNRIVHDSMVLFFFEPSSRYAGQFTIFSRRSAGNDSPIFTASDIRKELKVLAPEKTFQVELPTYDNFNDTRKDSVRVTVKCAQSLYDQYVPIGRTKGPWQPAVIDITVYWRDTPDPSKGN